MALPYKTSTATGLIWRAFGSQADANLTTNLTIAYCGGTGSQNVIDFIAYLEGTPVGVTIGDVKKHLVLRYFILKTINLQALRNVEEGWKWQVAGSQNLAGREKLE